MAELTVQPTLTLLNHEELEFSTKVSTSGEDCTAYLTNYRIAILFASKPLVAIPLSHIVSTKASVVTETNKKLMMMVQYLMNPCPKPIDIASIPKTDLKQLILTFIDENGAAERAKWRDCLTLYITTNSIRKSDSNEAQKVTESATISKQSIASFTIKSSPVVSSSTGTLETRARLLARHVYLKQLHNDLVVSGIVAEEEFWQSRASMLQNETEATISQSVGVSNTVASTKAQAALNDEGNGGTITVTLDSAAIHNIFVDNPAVHRAYQQLVPEKFTEKEFWTKYLKSQYIYQQKRKQHLNESNSNQNSKVSDHDEFEKMVHMETKQIEEIESRKSDGHNVKHYMLTHHVDPSIDLSIADASDAVIHGQPTVMDRDSTINTATISSANKAARKEREAGKNRETMVRRLNRHGLLVVQLPGSSKSPKSDSDLDIEQKNQSEYHNKLKETLTFHDLEKQEPVEMHVLNMHSQSLLETNVKSSPDDVDRVEKLLVEQFTLTQKPVEIKKVLPMPNRALCSSILTEFSHKFRGLNRAYKMSYDVLAQQSILTDDAGSATSSNKQLKKPSYIFSHNETSDVAIPEAFENELRKLYLTCNELLSHFYSLLPITATRSAKIDRIKTALDTCYKGIIQLRKSINSGGNHNLAPLLKPIMNQIEHSHAVYIQQKSKLVASDTQVKVENDPNDQARKKTKVG